MKYYIFENFYQLWSKNGKKRRNVIFSNLQKIIRGITVYWYSWWFHRKLQRLFENFNFFWLYANSSTEKHKIINFWKKIEAKAFRKKILEKKFRKKTLRKKILSKKILIKKRLIKNFDKKKLWNKNFEKNNMEKKIWAKQFLEKKSKQKKNSWVHN